MEHIFARINIPQEDRNIDIRHTQKTEGHPGLAVTGHHRMDLPELLNFGVR